MLRALAQEPDVEIVVYARRFMRDKVASAIEYRHAWWLNDLTFFLFFGLVARLSSCDCILTTLSVPCVLPLGLRQAVCIHDLAWIRYPSRFTRLQLAYFWLIHAVAARVASVLYCPSRATADDLGRHFRPRGEVLVTPWGADHLSARPADLALAHFQAEFGLDLSAESVLVTIGTLQPRKGYAHVLDALKRVDRRIVYVVFGNAGWLSDEVIAGIDAFNAAAPKGSRVLWVRNATDELIASTLSAAGLFVLASEYEGFGLPVVEAMKACCPVTVADNSSLRELVAEGQPTFPTGSADALAAIVERIFDDSTFRERQRYLSLQQAERFRWSHGARRLAEALR
jgi:glycosyltransferase involved in cell wall biosynthesis